MDHPCRLSLLGAEVDLVTPAMVLDLAARGGKDGRAVIVANHNLHSLYLHARDARVREFFARADVIEFDSTPLIAWARLLGHPVSRAHRSTYLDFRHAFWTMTEARGLRVYHVGGAPGVEDRAKAAILERHPRAHLDVHHGYFDMTGPANDAVIADIVAKRPDILFVGMGMPRQELWILDNLDRLPPCAILPVGGAFDYEGGAQYEPPRWTGRLGVEWLARFAADPRRLFTRYFLEPWALVPAALADVTGRKVAVVREAAPEVPPWVRRQALSRDNAPEEAPEALPEAEPKAQSRFAS